MDSPGCRTGTWHLLQASSGQQWPTGRWSRCRQCWNQICGGCKSIPDTPSLCFFWFVSHLALDYSRGLAVTIVTWNFDSPSEHLIKANTTSPRKQSSAGRGLEPNGCVKWICRREGCYVHTWTWVCDLTIHSSNQATVMFFHRLTSFPFESLLSVWFTCSPLTGEKTTSKLQKLSKSKYPTHQVWAKRKQLYIYYIAYLTCWLGSLRTALIT